MASVGINKQILGIGFKKKTKMSFGIRSWLLSSALGRYIFSFFIPKTQLREMFITHCKVKI